MTTEMNDLVKSLRCSAELRVAMDSRKDASLLSEAADEIERLLVDNANLTERVRLLEPALHVGSGSTTDT